MKWYLKRFLIFSISLAAFSARSYAMDVTLQWTANTEPALVGYRIYYKPGESGGYKLNNYNGKGALEGDSPVEVPLYKDENPDPNLLEFTLHDLADNKKYVFVVTAYDNNFESGASNEAALVTTDEDSPVTLSHVKIGTTGHENLTFVNNPKNGSAEAKYYNEATVTIAITPVNDPPVAKNDVYNIPHHGSLSVGSATGVLTNDIDPDGDSLTATVISDVDNGTLTLNTDGSFTYIPSLNFNGMDSFTYQVDDSNGGIATAFATLAARVSSGQVVLYTFEEPKDGKTINDVSGVGVPLDLTVQDLTAITWIPGGGVMINSPTVIKSNGAATKVINTVKASQEMTVEVWARPRSNSLPGFPMIVGVLDDQTSGVDFILAQDRASYFFGLRTSDADKFGDAFGLVTPAGSVAADLTHLVCTHDSFGNLKFYVNGILVVTRAAAADYSSWDNSYVLSLGNDPTLIWPWLGELQLAAIFDRALSASEVATNYVAGPPSLSSVPPNVPPLGLDDVYHVSKGGAIDTSSGGLRSVLGNDSDQDGDLLMASLVNGPSEGTLSFESDGTFTYTHNGSDINSDSFTYSAEDGRGGSDTATVTILIDAAPGTLTAIDDFFSVTEGGILTVNAASGVLANDWVEPNEILNAFLVQNTGPSVGTLSFNSDGSFTYQQGGSETTGDSFIYKPDKIEITYRPGKNFSGTDNFSYFPQGSGTASYSVTVLVRPINDLPAISDIADQATDEDTSLGPLAFTVGDVETPAANLVVSGSSDNQGLVPDANIVFGGSGENRTVMLSPTSNESGTAAITVTVSDGTDTASDSFVLTVKGVNDAPKITGTILDQTQDEDAAPWSIDLTVFESDPEDAGTALKWSVSGVDTALFNAVISDLDGDILTFTPVANAHGWDSITLTLTDSGGLEVSQDITVTFKPLNDAPLITGQKPLGTLEETALTITVGSLNIVDPDDSEFTLTVRDGSNYTGTGSTILPAKDFNGVLIVPVTVKDGKAESPAFNLTVQVNDVNDDPRANPDAYSVNEGDSLVVTAADSPLKNDSDIDNDPLIATLLSAPAHHKGNFELNADGTFSYSHDGSETTRDSFVYEVGDGRGGNAQANVTITVSNVNDRPVGVDDSVGVRENSVNNIIDVLANDYDVDDGDIISVEAIISGASRGTVSLVGGKVYYTPDADYTGNDAFGYRISDGSEAAVASVTIAIYPPLAITNKPAETLSIQAGDASSEFNVEGGDGTYTWTVTGPAAVPGGKGKTYTFIAPETVDFAGVYTIRVADGVGFEDSFEVKVPIKVTPDFKCFTETGLDGSPNPQGFEAKGASGNYTWEILGSLDGAAKVANPGDYGSWDKASPVSVDNKNTLNPADVAEFKVFYVRVTVDGDPDLTEANGLNRKIVGPFTLIPVDAFTVSVTGNGMAVSGAEVRVDYATVAPKSTNFNGTATFLLPDTGGIYAYFVTAPPGWIDTEASSSSKSVVMDLEEKGVMTISGTVRDTLGHELSGVTLFAYQPSDFNKKYQATSDKNGDYIIPLSKGASQSNWSVLATLANYEPVLLTDQVAGPGLDFDLQQKTIINVADPIVVGNTVALNITANPDFTSLNQLELELAGGTGTLRILTLADETVSVDYDAGILEDFTVVIKADTSEDGDPSSGYFASHVYPYVSGVTSAQIGADPAGTSGKEGMTENGQTCDIEVPPGGISKQSTILIKKLPKNYDSYTTVASPAYVYEITPIDSGTGLPLEAADIERIEITIPIDLRMVQPGDLERGRYVIYKAENQVSLDSDRGTGLPPSQILSTDYVGDGQIGSVTFWVDSLSVFGVGTGGSSTNGGQTSYGGAGGGGCFISSFVKQ